MPRVGEIHKLLADVEAYGSGPNLVGRLLCSIDRQVLIADALVRSLAAVFVRSV